MPSASKPCASPVFPPNLACETTNLPPTCVFSNITYPSDPKSPGAYIGCAHIKTLPQMLLPPPARASPPGSMKCPPEQLRSPPTELWTAHTPPRDSNPQQSAMSPL